MSHIQLTSSLSDMNTQFAQSDARQFGDEDAAGADDLFASLLASLSAVPTVQPFPNVPNVQNESASFDDFDGVGLVEARIDKSAGSALLQGDPFASSVVQKSDASIEALYCIDLQNADRTSSDLQFIAPLTPVESARNSEAPTASIQNSSDRFSSIGAETDQTDGIAVELLNAGGSKSDFVNTVFQDLRDMQSLIGKFSANAAQKRSDSSAISIKSIKETIFSSKLEEAEAISVGGKGSESALPFNNESVGTQSANGLPAISNSAISNVAAQSRRESKFSSSSSDSKNADAVLQKLGEPTSNEAVESFAVVSRSSSTSSQFEGKGEEGYEGSERSSQKTGAAAGADVSTFIREAVHKNERGAVKEALTVDKQLLEPIREAFHFTARNETRAIKVSLNPESLGHVEIQISRDAAGKMSVQIHAESADARNALADGIDHLRESLERIGLPVESLDVRADLGENAQRQGYASEGDNANRFYNEVESDAFSETSEESRQSSRDEARLLNIRI